MWAWLQLMLGARADGSDMVMLQAFDWNSLSNRPNHLNYLISQVDDWASAGITGAWLPQISDSVDKQGYIPQRWYTAVNPTAVSALMRKLKESGIMPIAETVLNHRGAPYKDDCTGYYTRFEDPPMGNWAVVKQDVDCSGTLVCPERCGCTSQDTGEGFCGSNDLDHTNDQVRRLIKEYLNYLKGLGFQGLRWDMTKGFHGKYSI